MPGRGSSEVIYDVPDYFSGTLTIMAVAVAPDAVGSAETNSLVRGPFVLTPNVPTVAAPGDRFRRQRHHRQWRGRLRRRRGGAGERRAFRAPGNRASAGKPADDRRRPRGQRDLHACGRGKSLAPPAWSFAPRPKGEEAKLRSTLSVRPAVPFMTTVQSGHFTGSEQRSEARAHASTPISASWRRRSPRCRSASRAAWIRT